MSIFLSAIFPSVNDGAGVDLRVRTASGDGEIRKMLRCGMETRLPASWVLRACACERRKPMIFDRLYLRLAKLEAQLVRIRV